MPDAAAIRTDLRRFLVTEVFAGRDPASIGDDDDLVAMGLDSLAVLRLVLYLETEFGLDLEGDDVLGQDRATVRAIAERCAARAG